MEDQTLDAIDTKGRAWSASAIYDFADLGFEGFNSSLSYGSFKANDSALYNTIETDITLSYDVSNRLGITLAYALIDDRTASNDDYT